MRATNTGAGVEEEGEEEVEDDVVLMRAVLASQLYTFVSSASARTEKARTREAEAEAEEEEEEEVEEKNLLSRDVREAEVGDGAGEG
jgi:hypothetical protein